MKLNRLVACFLYVTLLSTASAETVRFGEGDDAFGLEFVTIGDVGNVGDERVPGSFGAVDYEYQMAKFEVSCAMALPPGRAGLFQFGFGTFCPAGTENHPIYATWDNAAIFINWLNTSSGFQPAYKFNGTTSVLWQVHEAGYDPENPIRNAQARYVLPTAHEWHKAAYFDPSTQSYRLYSTGDTPPRKLGPEGGTEPNTARYSALPFVDIDKAGGLSAYGTMAMDGNGSEWEETPVDMAVDDRKTCCAERAGFEVGRVEELSAINSRTHSLSGSAIRVVALPVLDALDCDFNGSIDVEDLRCSNSSGVTPLLLSELGLVPGDLNGDGTVNFGDFLALSANFNEDLNDYTKGDINVDGTVNFADFLILSVNFEGNGQAAAVPEPSTLALFGLALCGPGVLRRRRAGVFLGSSPSCLVRAGRAMRVSALIPRPRN